MRKIREINVVSKKKYDTSIALLFPSTYRASLSSLALQILYFYLNEKDEIFAERVVTDVNNGTKSIEANRVLSKFDYVLVLSSYELDYSIAISMLMRAGINPLREKREKPIIIWGGPSPTAYPWPLYYFADAVLRGEAEAFLDYLVEIILEGLPNKRLFLEELSKLREAWIPSIKETSTIGRVDDLDKAFFPIRQIQSLDVEPFLGRAFIIEPSRGCGRGCRFCLESAILGNRRERGFDRITNYIVEGINLNKVDKVAFYTLSFFDSNRSDDLLMFLIDKGIKGSVPSVRADSLNENRIELLKMIGQRIVTIAPETPSEKLQLVINKMINWEKVIEIANICKKYGLFIKLYYMYGLPGEDEKDLELIVKQVKEIHDVMGTRKSVRVSIVPFTPKPFTLMWKEKMLELRELKRKERFLRRNIVPYARVDSYPPKLSKLQHTINEQGREAWREILRLANIPFNIDIISIRDNKFRGLEEIG